ncbi:MAG TPA: hypothetical protein VJZ75_01900 [Candidatus Bathyarchaeia archaeon]|nr:hypothetical protein [Candidatus Bathyarchaeia archaeon]
MTKATTDMAVAALVTRLEAADDTDTTRVTTGLVKLMICGARSPGFYSGDILPPSPQNKGWTLVQRFTNADQANAFKQSDERRQLLEQISGIKAGVRLSDEVTMDVPTAGGVGTAIVTDVKPGMENEYFAWEQNIQTAQARFPGYRGNYFQPPAPGSHAKWITLVRFDTPQTLEKWFTSDERKQLVLQAQKFVTATQFKTMASSFPGWFPTDAAGESPAIWKTAMLVLLGLFPTVMLEIRFLSPLMSSLNPSLSSFLSLVLSVAVTTWGTMPPFIRAFKWWLLPKKESRQKINIYGTTLVICLFIAEIAALWTLLPKQI